MNNTSNPLRYFSVIIHSSNTISLFCKQEAKRLTYYNFCYAHGFAMNNTSNPLRCFSVIIHSSNTISLFCKQKADSIWLIVHNKKAQDISCAFYIMRMAGLEPARGTPGRFWVCFVCHSDTSAYNEIDCNIDI